MNTKPTYIIDRLDGLISHYQTQVGELEEELAKEYQNAGTKNTYRALYNKARGALIELKRIRDEILTGTVVLYK